MTAIALSFGSSGRLAGDASQYGEQLSKKGQRALGESFRNRTSCYRALTDRGIAHIVEARWPRPCEDAFRFLADKSPDQLAVLIRDGDLLVEDLTFAAEIAGGIDDANLVAWVLFPLLSHANPVVREGAIYGLAVHLTNAKIRSRLHEVAQNDSNDLIRSLASSYANEV